MKRKSLISLGAAAAVALAACSGGGGAGGGDRAARPGDAGGSAQQYCALTRSYVDKYRETPAPDESPESIRRVYEEAARDIRAALAVAPAEIRADVQMVSEGLDRLMGVLAKYDYDGARLAEAPESLTDIDTAEFEAAGSRVEAYTDDICR